MNADSLPLAGHTVVELGSSVAAPYATWILGMLGADVIKIENPDAGDDARRWGRMFPDGSASHFVALNGNKKSVTINLKDERERAWLEDTCAGADAVIQNMRPGKVAQHGLDGVSLVARSPALVYCNLGAFGAVGPNKDKPGYDPLMQASAGIMALTGEPDRPPVRVGVSIIDMGTGLWCAIGILSALYQRKETGRGCIIDASLYETAVAWTANQSMMVQADGNNPPKEGSGARGMAPYQAYRCADGWLVVSAPNDRLFERLSKALGHPEWPYDEHFASNQKRYANLVNLNGLLVPIFEAKSRDHWMALLDEAGVPSAPVREIDEMLVDPQTQALGILQEMAGGGINLMGLPLSFDGKRPPQRSGPPALGQHNDLKVTS
ncbi:MAG: CoA transferase [Rhodospirillaceae bacterium]|nr:CoA transferase [Rhodospirillaceae bacterium]|tara:strand:- start:35755 stop:36891 length:1137 start_codon:yes stop_codon:yes gene_type:complete